MLIASPITAGEAYFLRCSTIKDDSHRLACYDTLARAQLSPPVENTRAPSSKWQITTSSSALGDNDNIVLSLPSASPVKSRYQTVTPELQIRCEDERSTVSIRWGVYLGKNSTTAVNRFDSGAATSLRWFIAEDKRTINFWGDAQEFIQLLRVHNTLRVQVTPYNADTITASFNISGFSTLIAPYRLSCQW